MNLARIRKSKAFTLIELIVVIVIIGILVAALAFAYTRFIDGTRQEASEAIANQVGKTVQADSGLSQATIQTTIAATPWSADITGSGATVTAMGTAPATPTDLAATPQKLHIAKDGKYSCVTFGSNYSGAKYTVAVAASSSAC